MAGQLDIGLVNNSVARPDIQMAETLYILTGPTAAGKSALALTWAEANNAEILSCDSMLVYRGMDIGTAKPSAEERRRAPHHGLDLIPVNQPFSVGEYVEMARGVVADIFSRGRKVLVVGGSGFYLKSFFAPVTDRLEIPPQIKQTVKAIAALSGLDGLRSELLKLNPDGVGEIDMQNPRRVQSALERCLASGRSVIALRRDFESQTSVFHHYEKRVCCLRRDREDLKRRIQLRVNAMLEAGLVKEVRGLLEAGIKQNPNAASAIGYRETITHIEKDGSIEDLKSDIVKNTISLVKKQHSWLKKQISQESEMFLDEAETGDPEQLFNIKTLVINEN